MGQYKSAFVELLEAYREDEAKHSEDYPVSLDLKGGHSREDIKRFIGDRAPGLDYQLYMRPKDMGTEIHMLYRVRLPETERNRLDVELKFRFG